jgi:ABC-type sugar transport system ATPase subunit
VQNRKKASKSHRWASISPNNSSGDTNANQFGVSLKNLTKVYPTGNGGQRVAVNNITVDFMVNEVTALLGHNGAGKSTMM